MSFYGFRYEIYDICTDNVQAFLELMSLLVNKCVMTSFYESG
jgi:hypothetical protein